MKKFSKIHVFVLAGLLAVTGAISLGLAQSAGTDQNKETSQGAGKRGKGRHHGSRGFHGGGRLMKDLNLTDAQKTQMKQIRQSFHERTAGLRQELHTKRQELRQANQGDTFNESLVAQKLSEMSGGQARLMSEKFRLRQEMNAVLTPEQKTKLQQQREQFKSRRAERGSRQTE